MNRYKNIQPISMDNNPRYVAEGEEFGDTPAQKRPKWQSPSGPLQKRILEAANRKYYQTHNERSAVIAIEKASISLTGGLISTYPLEWVESCLEWSNRKRIKDGMLVSLSALINLINNSERRNIFVTEWQRKNPQVRLRRDVNSEDELSVEDLEKETPIVENTFRREDNADYYNED